MIQLLTLAIILLSLLFLAFLIKKKNSPYISAKLMWLTFFYHTLFSYAYYKISLTKGADSIWYFESTREESVSYTIGGANFIRFILSHLPEFNYLSFTLLFGFFGLIGIWLLIIIINENSIIKDKRTKLMLLAAMLLPGINYWTSSLGKDSLIFFAIMLGIYAISNLKNRLIFLAVSILLTLHIRPHIAIAFILSFFLTLLLNSELPKARKLLLLLAGGISIAFMTTLVSNFVGVDITQLSQITDKIEEQGTRNISSNTSYHLAASNPLFRVFTYLYRPLFYDASTLLHAVFSIENFIYLSMFFYILHALLKRKLKYNFLAFFLLIYFSAMTLLLSQTTANIGIALRQKTMFISAVTILFFMIYTRKKYK